ncbi:cyclophilin-like fold protein [Ochrobactrum quorumnocens]|nr:cyclophilin-like fold protein [[Ochrobactrum] quorumnocens]
MSPFSSRSRRRLLAAGAASLFIPTFVSALTGRTQAQGGTAMRLRLTFADQDFIATLEDNPSAHDLFAMLSLVLTIDDYSTNEKIAYLPRKLTEEGSGRFGNEAIGDLCYYAPWGNLAMFHGPYHWSRGLIRLGRLDKGAKPLLVRGEFPLRIEASS